MAYIGKQPVVGNFVKLDAITTSATATYNLLNGGVAYSPQSANNCIVSLNGIIQEPTSSGNVGGYTISGSTIVFTSALTSLDVIDFILVLGDTLSIGTPSDGTVTFPKVTSNLITGATAETSIAGGDSILIYDDSASALRKMTRTNFVAGIGASAGQVIQVVNAEFDTSVSVTGSVVATGIIASITPSSTSSKILIMITLGGMRNSGTSPSHANIYVYRKIGAGSYSSFNQLEGGFFFTPSGMYTTMNLARNIYDTTHNTTSQIDYQIYLGTPTGTTNINVDGVESSTITLLEVKG